MIRCTRTFSGLIYTLLWFAPLCYLVCGGIQMPHRQPAQYAPKVLKTPPHEPVVLVTKDGLHRRGIYIPSANPKGNIILCHSATHSKEKMLPYATQLFADYNCLMFDFRRHGEPDGTKKEYCTSGKKEMYEVEAAIKFFRDRIDTKDLPLYGFGISMGAAFLIEYESKHPTFDGLILQSCFESLRKQIKRQYGFFRIPFMHNLIFREPCLSIAAHRHRLKLRKFSPMELIKSIQTPILLIHAKNDSFITFDAFEKLCERGRSIIQTWTPEDGKHTKILELLPDEYLAQCTSFFATLKSRLLAKNAQGPAAEEKEAT